MPLSMAKEGEPVVIKKVGGKDETRQFLENLGFVAGGTVTVVSEINGNLIVNVKESRVAIGKDMANKIMVWFIANPWDTAQSRGAAIKNQIEL